MSFARSLVDPDWPLPGDLRHGTRIAVYRNNIPSALAAALAVRFPKVKAISGEQAFRAMALAYSREFLPQSPVLISYGAEFTDFAERHGADSEMPFLGDLAQLENAWWDAYHAAEALPVSREAFAAAARGDLEALKLVLHPSVSLLSSSYPIASIWQAGRHPEPGHGSETVLVARPHAEVMVRVISDQFAFFLQQLIAGHSLGDAALATTEAFPNCDPAQFIGALIGLELVTHLKPGDTP